MFLYRWREEQVPWPNDAGCGRGPVVKTPAVAKALAAQEKRVGGAVGVRFLPAATRITTTMANSRAAAIK
ncbi:MAG: hypothetical protein BWY83_00276 [bacterium ADurb.Bin478]|nr:MAG: hypothetical protein BWY83_00276 [bacterium ADurb.Bin478]